MTFVRKRTLLWKKSYRAFLKSASVNCRPQYLSRLMKFSSRTLSFCIPPRRTPSRADVLAAHFANCLDRFSADASSPCCLVPILRSNMQGCLNFDVMFSSIKKSAKRKKRGKFVRLWRLRVIFYNFLAAISRIKIQIINHLLHNKLWYTCEPSIVDDLLKKNRRRDWRGEGSLGIQRIWSFATRFSNKTELNR